MEIGLTAQNLNQQQYCLTRYSQPTRKLACGIGRSPLGAPNPGLMRDKYIPQAHAVRACMGDPSEFKEDFHDGTQDASLDQGSGSP
ncbi:hypothetical protein V2V21_31430 [Pseudomonas aeruginosa]